MLDVTVHVEDDQQHPASSPRPPSSGRLSTPSSVEIESRLRVSMPRSKGFSKRGGHYGRSNNNRLRLRQNHRTAPAYG